MYTNAYIFQNGFISQSIVLNSFFALRKCNTRTTSGFKAKQRNEIGSYKM
jgi:hypothetical protein